MSLEEYLRYLKNNTITPVRMYLHNGNIKIYEIPSYTRAEVGGGILALMAVGFLIWY